MKTPVAIAVAASVLAFCAAAPAMADDVKIKDAVARVVVIPEDRPDISVEVNQGSAALPALRVTRRGDHVTIDGDIPDRQIRRCSGQSADARQPGQGASVEVGRRGRIALDQAPMITIRAPRNVEIDADGAVFGSIGRGAASIELGNAGCGTWQVANTPGALSLSLAGSGDIRAGTAGSLEASVAGSGNVNVVSARSLEASLAGSGNINVGRIDGPVEASIAGSGNVTVRDGRASRVEASIAGSGNLDFNGAAGSVEANLIGSGDVRVASVSGNVERNVLGSGRVIIGR